MEIERNYLIMLIFGYYMHKYPDSLGIDLIIHVDNHLIKNNNPILTDEEKKLVNDVHDQMWISLKIQGMNRKEIRRISKS